MSISSSAANHRWSLARQWTLLTVVTVLIRLPLLLQHQAIDDEVNYSVIARQLMNGGVLYTDAVERRPPLTFWVYEAVFRVAGHDNWFALHCVAVLWVLLTMTALAALASRLYGPRVGFAAACIYSVFQPWWYFGNLAFNGEVLMNLPVAVAFMLCLGIDRPIAPWRPAGAGALVALAFLLKQPAALAIVPLAIYFVQRNWRETNRAWRAALFDVGCLAAGCALVLGTMAAWLTARGILHDALYWSILDHDVPHVFWGRAVEHTAAFLVVALPVHAGVWWAFRDRRGWRTKSAEGAALLWLLVVSAAGAAASGRFFPHYYIGLLPALALLAAPAAEWLPLTRRFRPATRYAPAAAVAWTVAVVCAAFGFQLAQATRIADDTEAGRYIRAHSNADARVFVWGRVPRIYLDSDRQPAARFIDTFALTGRMFGPRLAGVDTSQRVLHGAWTDLRDDFRAHPPAFVVDTQVDSDADYPVSQFPWLADLLQRDYAPVAHVGEGLIYQRHQHQYVEAGFRRPVYVRLKPDATPID